MIDRTARQGSARHSPSQPVSSLPKLHWVVRLRTPGDADWTLDTTDSNSNGLQIFASELLIGKNQ